MSEALHFDAVITPNRSLSRRGYKVLIAIMVAVNLVLAGVFAAMGALPVPIFLGLDVLALIVAFQANYRSGRQQERVQVSVESVTVLNQIGGRARVIWRSPTAFTKVEVDRGEADETRVRLAISGRRRQIGRALSPGEQLELARALERAILAARRAPSA